MEPAPPKRASCPLHGDTVEGSPPSVRGPLSQSQVPLLLWVRGSSGETAPGFSSFSDTPVPG